MKIVYLTTENLYGSINSGSLQCSYGNLKLLEKLAVDQNIFHVFLGDKSKKIDDYKYEYRRVEGRVNKFLLSIINRRFLFPTIEHKIVKLILMQNPDVIFYEGPYWAYIVKKLKKRLSETKFILFMHNVEKIYYKNLVEKSSSYKILYRVTCTCEELSIKCADKIICLNERDNKQLKELYNRSSDLLLPIHMKDQFNECKVINGSFDKTLLFVGSLFPPNYDGIKWFIENVMDELKEYKLVVVGRGFENVAKELERKNVEIIGSVENLQEYYYEYPVLVMPILYGAGMKVKTAEALMYGKTIIGSKEALEGYNTSAVEGIYECNSKNEYLGTITEVFKDDRYRRTRGQVRELFLNKFETEQLSKLFSDKMSQWILEEK